MNQWDYFIQLTGEFDNLICNIEDILKPKAN